MGSQRTRLVATAVMAGLVLAACGSPTRPAGAALHEAAPASSGNQATISIAPAATSASRAPIVTAASTSIALVPVVGFWSKRKGISSANLAAALDGTSTTYRRVLVAGVLTGATTATPDRIRRAVNKDPRTLGLLPAGDVTLDVRALKLAGRDLFGNERIRDLAAWPLLVSAPPTTDPTAFDPTATWTLAAGGDVMLDRTIYLRSVIQRKGANYPWKGGDAEITGRRCCTAAGHPLPVVRRVGGGGAVRDLFRDADLAVVNLEGPAVKDFQWHPRGLTFTFDPDLLTGLRYAGVDVVTIGNNHIGNAGRAGVVETIRHLDTLDIAHVGAGRDRKRARKPAWFDVAGQRVALLGYDAVRPGYNATSTRPGSAGLDPDRYRADVTAARAAGADVVVVLPHWGREYTAAPTDRQRAHAGALTKAGATVILGSHSHWAGAMETIRGRPVFYSLGNLIFDLVRSEETVEGLVVEITFVGARPAQIRLHPTVMVDLVQPNRLSVPGDGSVVIERMRRASEAIPAR